MSSSFNSIRSAEHISAQRNYVLQSYEAAKAKNHIRFVAGNALATIEYIFPNQTEDGVMIVHKMYKNHRRVISIQKKTKVGADGLIIEIAKLVTTHPDDNFVVNLDNVRILTGMSNAQWEDDMKEKAPECFKDKIFHHGQLTKADLTDMKNCLIIVDEIDTGNKEKQVLHRTLKDAGILDIQHMETNNNRFVFISATMIKELYELYRWGELHELYKMTIPSSYIGHKDFLEMGIAKEFYPLTTDENAEKWVKEDILENYGNDYRVHIVRVNPKTVDIIQNACIRNGIVFRNHTSTDRISEKELKELFESPIFHHTVIGVKGLYRRANLIPNRWKLRIGATHELYTKIVDNNVQNQGLPGRMTGYWRDVIEAGHKTGPYRTSIRAIEEYEETYEDPFGENSYHTNGFTKKRGKVSKANPTFLSPKNIENLEPTDHSLPNEGAVNPDSYRIYDNDEVVRKVCSLLGYHYVSTKENRHGFKETSLNTKTSVVSLHDAIKKVPTAYGTNKGEKTYRTYYPCYVDTTNKDTLRFVIILRPRTDESKIAECDANYPSIPYVSPFIHPRAPLSRHNEESKEEAIYPSLSIEDKNIHHVEEESSVAATSAVSTDNVSSPTKMKKPVRSNV